MTDFQHRRKGFQLCAIILRENVILISSRVLIGADIGFRDTNPYCAGKSLGMSLRIDTERDEVDMGRKGTDRVHKNGSIESNGSEISPKKDRERLAQKRKQKEKMREGIKIALAIILALILVLTTLSPLMTVFGESGEPTDSSPRASDTAGEIPPHSEAADRQGAQLFGATVLSLEGGNQVKIRFNTGIWKDLAYVAVYDPARPSDASRAGELQKNDKVIVSVKIDGNGAPASAEIVEKGEMANREKVFVIPAKVLETVREDADAVQWIQVEMKGDAYKGLELLVPFDRKDRTAPAEQNGGATLLPALKKGDGVTLYVETDKYGAISKAYVQMQKSKAETERMYGVVTEVLEERIDSAAKTHTQMVTVRLDSREWKGLECYAQFERNAYFNEGYLLDELSVGDKVVLQLEKDIQGAISKAYVADVKKEHLIYLLIALFFLCLILVGGWKGVKAIVSLILTAIMVFFVFIPLILKGYPPVLLSMAVCIVVVALSFLIITGWNRKTFAAAAGTIFGIIIAGVMFLIFTSLMKITGVISEHARMLLFIPQKIHIDFKGLLFAGVLIASMGASMDIGMTVSSTVNEVGINSPGIRKMALFRAGLNVGRDAMATMTNTLILAYVGTSLNLVLLLNANSVHSIVFLNWEILAVEITRALTATIGLVSAIPITAFIAAELFDKTRTQ